MEVIILAGGRATRLSHLIPDTPKALLKIGGKSILGHQLNLLQNHGFSDIRLALGYKAEHIVDYLQGKYEYTIEPEPLGTGGAIKFASQDITEPFMVLNGDIISDVDVAAFAAQHKKGSTSLVVSYHAQNTDFGLLEIGEYGKIKRFLEKPEAPTDGYVNVGFYIFDPSHFNEYPHGNFSVEYHMFPALAQRGMLYSFEHKGFWSDLGTAERVHEMRLKFSEQS